MRESNEYLSNNDVRNNIMNQLEQVQHISNTLLTNLTNTNTQVIQNDIINLQHMIINNLPI